MNLRTLTSFMIFLLGYLPFLFAQCPASCDITISSNQSGNINASNGQTVCIKNGATFTGNIQNLNNGTVCIEAGATWNTSNLSGSNNTINVFGTLSTSANSLNSGTINLENGAQLVTTSNFQITNQAQINVKSGSQWDAAQMVTVLGDGPANSGGSLIVEEGGLANFDNGLENNEGKLTFAGMVNVTGEYYNHGRAEITSTGMVTTDDFRMTLKSSGVMQIDGKLIVNGDALLQDQGPTGSGFLDIGGDLTMTNQAGLGGTLLVGVDGTSTLGQCSTGNISSGITFCDSSPGVDNINDFDNNNCSQVVGYTVAVDCNTLPVTLLFFKLKNKTEERFFLEWGIADAVNFSHFEIEESENGKDFRPIEKIMFETVDQIYQSQPYAQPDRDKFFRLKMVDLDETYEYSKILVVGAHEKTLRLFPNPTKQDFVVVEKEDQTAFTLNIFSSTGQLLKQTRLQGSNRYEIQLPPQSTNIYIVEMISGREVQTLRLVKE
ncbi:MAG: T9SS type A sorting domain-containing protein [Bacteroidota bacterium]